MDVCVVCKRKVEPTENWIRAHLWGGFYGTVLFEALPGDLVAH